MVKRFLLQFLTSILKKRAEFISKRINQQCFLPSSKNHFLNMREKHSVPYGSFQNSLAVNLQSLSTKRAMSSELLEKQSHQLHSGNLQKKHNIQKNLSQISPVNFLRRGDSSKHIFGICAVCFIIFSIVRR